MLDFIESSPFNHKKPRKLVILLHGYGSNKYDIFPLMDSFLDILVDAQCISVNAPFNCEFGQGFQWFPLKNMKYDYIYKEIKKNYKILQDFIDTQIKRFNLDYKDVLLIGFSQGAMLALYAGLRIPHKLRGIIAFSGLLVDNFKSLSNELKCKQDIMLIYGTDDEVIPPEYFAFSEKLLLSLGINFFSEQVIGLDHSIDIRAIQKAREFIRGIWYPQSDSN